MAEFLDNLVSYFLNGLGLGAIFAFIALGYTMVYGIIKLINFAHGEFFMVGAFAGYFCLRDLDLERLPCPSRCPSSSTSSWRSAPPASLPECSPWSPSAWPTVPCARRGASPPC